MRRGDIVSVSLDPGRGSEASKTRPAVIVSNDAATTTAARIGRGVITVVPVTSNDGPRLSLSGPAPGRPVRAAPRLSGTGRASALDAVERIGERIGRLPASLMAVLDDALRLHLAL